MTQPIESLPDWMAEAASSLPLLTWLLLIQTCSCNLAPRGSVTSGTVTVWGVQHGKERTVVR
jgi:hypothetical protein